MGAHASHDRRNRASRRASRRGASERRQARPDAALTELPARSSLSRRAAPPGGLPARRRNGYRAPSGAATCRRLAHRLPADRLLVAGSLRRAGAAPRGPLPAALEGRDVSDLRPPSGPMSARTVVVAASVAQKPRHGGHTWVVLQYLLGLRRIGFDVLLLDRLEPGMCRDADGMLCRAEDSTNVRDLEAVMESFALGECFALITDGPRTAAGLSCNAAAEQVRQADLLLDVMGFFRDDELAALAPFRVFLDIDPGFPQMWHALGLADPFNGYDAYVTIGERIGQADCTIPTCGLEWITTVQPVVLEEWAAVAGDDGAFTSVVTWRGANEPLDFGGRRYGVRAHEFRRFARLPELVDERFELALDIHPADAADRSLLRDAGWQLVDPIAAAGDPWRYRDFVQTSKAELMVAKNMY